MLSVWDPFADLNRMHRDLERSFFNGRGKPADIPIDASGETGLLARAFARRVEETNAKTSALEHEVEERRRTEAARDQLAVRERLFSAAVVFAPLARTSSNTLSLRS